MSEPSESARLHYEPLCAAHADELFSPLAAGSLYAYQPGEAPASVDALRARYQRLSRHRAPDQGEQWLNWVMREKTARLPVGMLQATVYPNHNAYIAYIVFVEQQRKGYAFEGVRWMLDTLGAHHGATNATADVDTRNAASNGLLAKLGFALTGMTTDADWFKGAGSDEFHYRCGLGSN